MDKLLYLAAAVLVLGLVLSLLPWPGTGYGPLEPAGTPAGPESVAWPEIRLAYTLGGLNQPVHLAHAGDGSGRLFVVERAGLIRVVRDGHLAPVPFLDISGRVESAGGEQGLLSVAFPPDYAGQGHFYVYYTDLNGDTVVSRFGLTADPNQADPASEQVVLMVPQPFANHNGGQLAFGPNDGYLYVGLGDGGSAGDPQGNGQNPAVLLGKLLRIDVESGSPLTYTVPASNPFTQTAGYRPEIWALGLRNPWRFAFDRETGDLYIGDVGQGSYEEIDFQPAASPGGENYGWNVMEGAHCYDAPTCDQEGLVLPAAEYDHAQGCSVTGGEVYRGWTHAELRGLYFYGKKPFTPGACAGGERPYQRSSRRRTDQAGFFLGISPADG